MSNKGPFYLFLLGTLSSLVLFLGLTWDTHRQVGALTNADKLNEQVVAGKHVWEKKNCNECHTILGFGVYYAPDLTRVYGRIGANGIMSAVLRPERIFADSIRKMPNLDVTQQEADDLVAFLEWVDKIDNHDWPPQDTAESRAQRKLAGAFALSPGAAAFKEQCMNCHAIGGAGGTLGPEFDSVGGKYDASEISRYVLDPKSVDPGSEMAAITDLSNADLQAIADFLAGQKGGE